jgi:hypothetical protein
MPWPRPKFRDRDRDLDRELGADLELETARQAANDRPTASRPKKRFTPRAARSAMQL